MSVRCCCFKDCENATIGHDSIGNFTLFQFPKDPVRRKTWMKLGQVDKNIPPNTLLMCSDHFDRSKFMSVNPRRTVLLSSAVPYAYGNEAKETNNENVIEAQVVEIDNMDSESTSYVYYEDANIQEQEEIGDVESTITDDKDGNILTYKELMNNAEESCVDEEKELRNAYIMETNKRNIRANNNEELTFGSSNNFKFTGHPKPHSTSNKKRKAIDEGTNSKTLNAKDTENTSSKLRKSIANTLTEKPEINNTSTSQGKRLKATSTLEYLKSGNHDSTPDGNNTANYEVDETDLIDQKNVTTFIFKNEEYIQMPKECYLNEKLVFLRKIKQYEDVLKNIQHSVNDFDFSELT